MKCSYYTHGMQAHNKPPDPRHTSETIGQAFEHGLSKGAKIPPQTTALWVIPFFVGFLALWAWLLFRVVRFLLRATR
ncbi:MAG TPA: hypothetical protein VGR84_15510 [Candidatus Acidoferrales bacterium]|nr:hypothetical protein [Candidatus Acidoferrales bacterium]